MGLSLWSNQDLFSMPSIGKIPHQQNTWGGILNGDTHLFRKIFSTKFYWFSCQIVNENMGTVGG